MLDVTSLGIGSRVTGQANAKEQFTRYQENFKKSRNFQKFQKKIVDFEKFCGSFFGKLRIYQKSKKNFDVEMSKSFVYYEVLNSKRSNLKAAKIYKNVQEGK